MSPNDSPISLDSCAFVQYRTVREGLVELYIDSRMWWHQEGDPEGMVRLRLTSADLEQMVVSCE